MTKKYTNISDKEDDFFEKLNDSIFSVSDEDKEYRRLVKGLLKAIKDDIKAEKKGEQGNGLATFTDELFEEYKQVNTSALEGQKELLTKGFQDKYKLLKNHVKEYALFDVDASNKELISKIAKNYLAVFIDGVKDVHNNFLAIVTGKKSSYNLKKQPVDELVSRKIIPTSLKYDAKKIFRSDDNKNPVAPILNQIVENRVRQKSKSR